MNLQMRGIVGETCSCYSARRTAAKTGFASVAEMQFILPTAIRKRTRIPLIMVRGSQK